MKFNFVILTTWEKFPREMFVSFVPQTIKLCCVRYTWALLLLQFIQFSPSHWQIYVFPLPNHSIKRFNFLVFAWHCFPHANSDSCFSSAYQFSSVPWINLEFAIRFYCVVLAFTCTHTQTIHSFTLNHNHHTYRK